MAYSLQIGQLFDVQIDEPEYVISIMKKARGFLLEGKTVMGWGSEGDSSNLEFSLPLDYIISECRYYLKRKDPRKYGHLVYSARQIRY